MKTNKLKIAVIVSKFNTSITKNLWRCCLDELIKQGVNKSNIKTLWVPGAYELPFVANEVAKRKKVDAIIGLGCVIKGQTSHDVHISNWVSNGLGMISLNNRIPVMFGVLTPNNEAQAIRRSRPGSLNRGKEVAEATIQTLKTIHEAL